MRGLACSPFAQYTDCGNTLFLLTEAVLMNNNNQYYVVAKIIVEQIPWASFQGGGLRSTSFVAIYQNVRLGQQF